MDKIIISPRSYVQRTGPTQATLQLFLILQKNFTASKAERKIRMLVNNKIVECFVVPANKTELGLAMNLPIKRNQKRLAVQAQWNPQTIKSDIHTMFIEKTTRISLLPKPDLHADIKNIALYVDSLNIEGYWTPLLLRDDASKFLDTLNIDDQRKEYLDRLKTVNIYEEYKEEIASEIIKPEHLHNLSNFINELAIVITKKYNPWEPIEWNIPPKPRPYTAEERKARGLPGVSDRDYGLLVL